MKSYPTSRRHIMHLKGSDACIFLCNMLSACRHRRSSGTTGITYQWCLGWVTIVAPRSRVTKGGPLSPTIFNMVVDLVIHLWVNLVMGEEAGMDGFGQAVQWLLAFCYANDTLLASSRLAQIQAVMDVLMGLFERVGLQTNIYQMVGMVC